MQPLGPRLEHEDKQFLSPVLIQVLWGQTPLDKRNLVEPPDSYRALLLSTVVVMFSCARKGKATAVILP